MKINKLNEDFQNDIENKFMFLNSLSDSKKVFDFLKSLNLTNEQYDDLAEIMQDYGYDRYTEGNQDGFDQGYEDPSY